MTKTKYNSLEIPEKIVELFGYNKNDSLDREHKLFNYPDFFAVDKTNALKAKDLLEGVVVYSRRNLQEQDLLALKMLQDDRRANLLTYERVKDNLVVKKSYARQSYTSLTQKSTDIDFLEYYEIKADFSNLQYKYAILNDSKFSGATFGVLFHELCEEYPVAKERITEKLDAYNVTAKYSDELLQIIDTAFNYSLLNASFLNNRNDLPDLKLANLTNKFAELKFNIAVRDSVSLKEKIAQVVEKHFGASHKFSQAIKALNMINQGFLVGAIDLFFEYNDKYWILDYKTNKLEDYTSVNVSDYIVSDLKDPYMSSSMTEAADPFALEMLNTLEDEVKFVDDSKIIESMAEHHYYLQYIIYLVVIKRYLENMLKIDDATHLLGGAIYYYVRGLYIGATPIENQCVYIDLNCQALIREVDELL